MFILLLIFLILMIFNFKYITRPLKGINKKTWIILISILFFFLILYWFFVPNVHRVYGDEPAILEASNSRSNNFRDSFSINSLYNLVYVFFGYDNVNPIKFNVFISILNLFLLFYLLYLLFENRFIAMLVPVLLAINSQYIALATSSYVIIISLMFALFSSIFLWLYLKYDKIYLNLLLLISFIFAATIRVEYILLVPISFIFWIVVKRRNINLKKKNIEYWGINLALWGLILVLFFYFIYLKPFRQKVELFENLPILDFGPSNFFNTLTKYFIPLFNNELIGNWLYVFFIALLISIFWLIKKKKMVQGIYLMSISVVFVVFYLNNIYYSGLFNVLIYAYSLFVVAILLSIIFKTNKKWLNITFFSILTIVIFIILFNSIKIVYDVETKNYYYLTTAAPEILESIIEPNCLVITPYAANIGMGTFITVQDTNYALKNPKIILEYECKYFFEDFLCGINEANMGSKEVCDYFKENYNLVSEIIIKDKNTRVEYVLYRFLNNSSIKNQNPEIIYADTFTSSKAYKFFKN